MPPKPILLPLVPPALQFKSTKGESCHGSIRLHIEEVSGE